MRLTYCLFSAAAIAASGCGGGTEPADEVVLTRESLSGVYYGVTFTTEENEVVTDQLRLGATIELILYAQGTSAGRLFMPADTSGCCELDASLIGTWELDGNIVTLSLSTETFLNGMPLAFEETHLSGERTIDNVTYRVVLAW